MKILMDIFFEDSAITFSTKSKLLLQRSLALPFGVMAVELDVWSQLAVSSPVSGMIRYVGVLDTVCVHGMPAKPRLLTRPRYDMSRMVNDLLRSLRRSTCARMIAELS